MVVDSLGVDSPESGQSIRCQGQKSMWRHRTRRRGIPRTVLLRSLRRLSNVSIPQKRPAVCFCLLRRMKVPYPWYCRILFFQLMCPSVILSTLVSQTFVDFHSLIQGSCLPIFSSSFCPCFYSPLICSDSQTVSFIPPPNT